MSESLSWSRAPEAPEGGRTAARALERGAWVGAWTVTVGTLPIALLYYLRWHHEDLPWLAMGLELASFTPICGALFGAGLALGLHLARARRWARPLLPAATGALFGLAPGAFAAAHFGAKEAPYIGTGQLLFAGAVAFFLFGSSLLREEGVPRRRAIPALLLALAPPALLAGASIGLLPDLAALGDALILDGVSWLHPTDEMPSAAELAAFGALIGAIAGALFGGLVGGAYALVPGARSTLAPRVAMSRPA